jgi:hypothetical protein
MISVNNISKLFVVAVVFCRFVLVLTVLLLDIIISFKIFLVDFSSGIPIRRCKVNMCVMIFSLLLSLDCVFCIR